MWSARGLRLASRRLTALLALAAAGCAASLIGFAPPAAAASLVNPTWSVSNSLTGATSVNYLYTFTTATAGPLSSVTMTVPSGTTGTLTVGTVSPVGLAGGTVARAGTTVTYTFTSVSIAAGTAVSIQIKGFTNTSTAGTAYTSTITTRTGATSVDTGTTPAVTLTATGMSAGPTWSASSTTVGATSVSYTYTFTLPQMLSALTISTITMTIPPGTSGSPTLGTVSPSGLGGSVSFAGNTLSYSGLTLNLSILAPTPVSIQINGLTNTPTAGSYTSEVVATGLLGNFSGVTGTVSFTGPLTLTSPGSLTWGAMLTGSNTSVADAVSGDQQLSVSDQTGSGAGWHITVSATTFTNGLRTFANTGTFVFTGSTSSVSATTAPTAACATSCIPPVDTSTYPVAITTALSPTPATVYDTSASSGLGPVTLGGSSAANPVGWWVNIPANARAGAYTTTVTMAIVSGP